MAPTPHDGDIADLRARAEALLTAIEADPDSQAGIVAATELAALVRRIADDAATLRAKLAARIRDQEKLTLAVLAERIGVSVSRADQLVKAAKNADKQREDAT
jgi:DNA-binding transcriptional regulator YiaG